MKKASICLITILAIFIFVFSSIPSLAYVLETHFTDQSFSVASRLEWNKDLGYREYDMGWSGGILNGWLVVLPGSGDALNGAVQVQISLSDITDVDMPSFHNFVHPVQFQASSGGVYFENYTAEVMIGKRFDIQLIERPMHVTFLQYPAVLDESDPLGAYVTVREVQYVDWSAKIIESVPEPGTMFLLGFGLMGVVGLRKKFLNN
jgi:hypothetical protein